MLKFEAELDTSIVIYDSLDLIDPKLNYAA